MDVRVGMEWHKIPRIVYVTCLSCAVITNYVMRWKEVEINGGIIKMQKGVQLHTVVEKVKWRGVYSNLLSFWICLCCKKLLHCIPAKRYFYGCLMFWYVIEKVKIKITCSTFVRSLRIQSVSFFSFFLFFSFFFFFLISRTANYLYIGDKIFFIPQVSQEEWNHEWLICTCERKKIK